MDDAIYALNAECDAMQDEILRLEAENAKLRKFAKIDTEDIDTMSCLVDDLRAENDRLREMAEQALQIIKHVNVVTAIDYARYSALMSMARELGIEVDG